MKCSVIGGGSWGLALAQVLADNNNTVKVFMRNKVRVDEFNKFKTIKKYLPGVQINSDVLAVSNYSEIEDSDLYVFAVPTQAIRSVLEETKDLVNQDGIFINVAKGIEISSGSRISMVFEEYLPKEKFVCLSGPSHAEEVSRRMPTTLVASSINEKSMNKVQRLFINNYFRIYTNSDLIGVELGGASKNVLALAVGIIDGMGYGDNSKAAIMTRGMHEIVRFGTTLGGKAETFYGLTGMGDLIVTATSVHSRNYRAGHLLGQGIGLKEAIDKIGMVVEGISTTKAIYSMGKNFNVDMPITFALYDFLFEGKSAKQITSELMSRERKKETLR